MLLLLQVLASNVMALVSCPLRSHPLVAESIPKPELACSYLRTPVHALGQLTALPSLAMLSHSSDRSCALIEHS